MILGIDTSAGTAVALIDPDGVVRAARQSSNALGHAEVIGTLLADALTEANALAAVGSPVPGVADAITAVAAGMGPGPFTGLRIGIAAARAFALARGIPVVPVASHDGVALGLLLDAAIGGRDLARFAVVTDARRRELAYTVYDGLDDDGLPVRVTAPALSPRDELDARLGELAALRHDASEIPAAMIALAAARAESAGRTIADVEPLYLRSPDVVAAHARKRVSA